MPSFREYTEKVRHFARKQPALHLLSLMAGYGRMSGGRKARFHHVLRSVRGELFIKEAELKRAYKAISNRISRVYIDEDWDRTGPERYAFDLLSELTGRELLSGVWIGNHCVDIFLPYFCYRGLVGLAIEIDGPVHFKDAVKVKKDEYGDHYLSFFHGIERYRIENHEVYGEAPYQRLVPLVLGAKPQFKAVNAMWRRIWIHTIAVHARPMDYERFFGIEAGGYRTLMGTYYEMCGLDITVPFFERRLARIAAETR